MAKKTPHKLLSSINGAASGVFAACGVELSTDLDVEALGKVALWSGSNQVSPDIEVSFAAFEDKAIQLSNLRALVGALSTMLTEKEAEEKKNADAPCAPKTQP